MRRRLIRLASAVAVLAAVVGAAAASAETCSLQIKRVETVSGRMAGPPADYMFRQVYPQHFYVQTGTDAPSDLARSGEAEFGKVIKKEPPSYNSKSPFRAVAKLGTQQFGFVLDSREAETKPAATDEESKKPASSEEVNTNLPDLPDYGRLLFDLNHNGDLTDDPVIEAESRGTIGYPAGFRSFSFPRVDLTIEADGTKIEYAFSLSGYSHAQYVNDKQLYQYVSAQLNAAAYREGDVTLDGKKLRIVVTDYNSNGRFDDVTVIDASVTDAQGTVYPRQGDMIYVDPQPATGAYAYGYDPTTNDQQYHLAKALNIGGHLYDVRITPAGDTLTLEPSALAIGYISNPNQGYRALVYGDQGIWKVCGDAAGRAPLPVGRWKLLMYTIDRTSAGDPAEPPGEAPSLLRMLANALFRREESARPSSIVRPRFTMVAARATGDSPLVEVREGETAQLRFGPPYEPRVSGSYLQNDGRLSLGMSLVGVAGEICNNLMIDGGRPGRPEFTITDPNGKVVERGNFEYG